MRETLVTSPDLTAGTLGQIIGRTELPMVPDIPIDWVGKLRPRGVSQRVGDMDGLRPRSLDPWAACLAPGSSPGKTCWGVTGLGGVQ